MSRRLNEIEKANVMLDHLREEIAAVRAAGATDAQIPNLLAREQTLIGRARCGASDVGCTCRGDVVQHNLQAIDRIKQRQADAPRSTCPVCGEQGNAAVIAGLGQCFDCKRDADAAVYGFAPSARTIARQEN